MQLSCVRRKEKERKQIRNVSESLAIVNKITKKISAEILYDRIRVYNPYLWHSHIPPSYTYTFTAYNTTANPRKKKKNIQFNKFITFQNELSIISHSLRTKSIIFGFQNQEFYFSFFGSFFFHTLNEPRNEQRKKFFVIYFKLDYGIRFSTVFLSISSLLWADNLLHFFPRRNGSRIFEECQWCVVCRYKYLLQF